MICYIVTWWPSWLSDQIASSNSESDVFWRVLRLPPWLPSWILELNVSAILNFHVTPIPPIKFWLNLTYFLGGDMVWRISRWEAIVDIGTDGCPMPLIMLKLNQTYRSVADVIWRFWRWLLWWPSWISERNYFNNSKSPCYPNAFHQVSTPSNLKFGSR